MCADTAEHRVLQARRDRSTRFLHVDVLREWNVFDLVGVIHYTGHFGLVRIIAKLERVFSP